MPGVTADAGMVSDVAEACVAGAWRSLCKKAFKASRLPCLPAQVASAPASQHTLLSALCGL